MDNPFKGLANRLYAPNGPPSYTLDSFYKGRLDTFNGKNVYIGYKYLRPRWPIPFRYSDLFNHLTLVHQYSTSDRHMLYVTLYGYYYLRLLIACEDDVFDLKAY